MPILNFNQYLNEGYEDINIDLDKKSTAGVAIVYDNKIREKGVDVQLFSFLVG